MMLSNGDKTRLRIAYFSPLPPTKSGIADYSRELLPHLAAHAEITIFSANPNEIDNALAKHLPIQSITRYPEKRWQYDLPLYQMGNSIHHEALYPVLLRYPGIVTLHDYSLYHFNTHRTVGGNHFAGYVRELGYELGKRGIEYARRIRFGEQTPSLYDVPFNQRLLDSSLGIIVHSRYARNLTLTRTQKTAVTVIPQHVTVLTGKSRRDQLPWPDNAVIFASIGQITAAKQIELALRAFSQIRQDNPNAYYLIVGEETADIDLSAIVRSLSLTNSVQHTGYVAGLQEFIDWIHTADIIINLRHPTIGETSATALRALAAGRPLILFDHGWYSELPDSTCVKIPPLDEDALVTAMSQLAQQPQKRQQLSEAGRQYIQSKHHPEDVAANYVSFIHQRLSKLKHKYGQ